MKISIDTKEDSHDEIRKVVAMLQAWVDGHTNAQGSSGGIMDMFNEPSQELSLLGASRQPASPEPSGGVSPDLFSLFKNETPLPPSNNDTNLTEKNLAGIEKDEDTEPARVELMTYD